MATTISSTDLDFNALRNSLKTFLAQKPEFADYNFEGAGLSNLLDVLAYNSHHNSLVANFALNESFLSTAQLRSSMVALAANLGYPVESKKSSFAVVNLKIFNPSNPSSMTMPSGFVFNATVNNKSYNFKTRDTLIATNDGSNNYFFALDGNKNVAIYQGTGKIKTFIAGPSSEIETYIVPTTNLDLDTVSVRVYENTTTNNYDLYTNINDTTSITSDSKIFTIKETPNGYYEVSFANGVRLGSSPQAGNKIEVIYDQVVGAEANGARTFSPNNTLDGYTVDVTTVSNSAGGKDKETIESIRKNAPYLYATQNRMVTAEDYSALILRNFSTVIEDIKSWGGEDNVPPKYGSVYVSIDFNTTDETVQAKTKQEIVNLADDLSVASFDVEFADPINTFLEVSTVFQWNQNLTSVSNTAIEESVRQVMQTYFDDNLGSFDKSFRRSNLLTAIDESDPSILSSRADIKMQYRLTPSVGTDTYSITFPAAITNPVEDRYVIESDLFYLNGVTCKLRNKLDTSVIEVLNVTSGNIEVDNIGSYEPSTGVISLSGFEPTLISGTYFKIVATPSNEATINPLRENILNYDANASSARAVVTNTV